MGGDGVYDKCPGGVPPPVGTKNHGDSGETRGRRRVEVPLGSGGNGSHRAPPHKVVHQATASDHSEKGVLPPHI